MLQDKVTRCISLIDEVQANRERKEDNEKNAQKNNRFFDAYNKFLRPILLTLKTTKDLPEFQFPNQLLDELKKQTDNTETILQTKVVTNPNAYYSNLSALFNSFIKFWENMVNIHDADLLSRLAVLKPLQSDEKEITQIINAIEHMRKCEWPITEELVFIYKNACERGNEVLSEMDALFLSLLPKLTKPQTYQGEIFR